MAQIQGVRAAVAGADPEDERYANDRRRGGDGDEQEPEARIRPSDLPLPSDPHRGEDRPCGD